ncbi:MAG TPA: PEP-CTERM sorting domain-containing protein [Vicinamibacterales bacterium]
MTASADSVRLVRYERYISAWALVYGSSGFVESYDEEHTLTGGSASATAVLAGTTASAGTTMADTLSSDALHLFGSSSSATSIAGPNGGAATMGSLALWFDVTSPQAFDFVADMSKYGFGSWQTALIQSPMDLGHQILRFAVSSNTGADQSLHFRGSLDPGSYVFSIRSDGGATTYFSNNPTGGAHFDFSYDMQPVPEPASLFLVGTGVMGVVARVRRRRDA